jgi:DNA-binding MarR family transcriptional regulator
MSPLAKLEFYIERISTKLGGRRADLSARQMRAFLIIAKASMDDEPINQEDLVHILGMPRQTASDTVRRFIELGLITREVCPTDRRTKCLVLTEHGQKFAQSLNEPEKTRERVSAARCGAQHLGGSGA